MTKSLKTSALALLVALAALAFAATPAFAATHNEAWTVEFTGTEMKDDGSSDIVKTLSGMQPGDSAEFDITLYEKYDKAADWYMRNQVLSTMEETFQNANDRSGGSYSYKLTYISPKGEEKVLLTNEVVSGDAGNATGAGKTNGLFDATTATGEYFFLDTLAPNAKAQVKLYVAIDGETHGNTYFDTSARIQLSFAAEPTDKPGTSGDSTTTTLSKDDEKKQAEDSQKNPQKLSQTGDTIALGALVIVVIGAAVVLVIAAVRRRAATKREEDDAR